MAALALGVLLGAGDASADSVFNATAAVRLCNGLPFGAPSLAGDPACVEVRATNAARDMTLTTDVPAGSVSFERLVSFAPGAVYEVPGTAFPVGATAGGARYFTTMGVLNGPCTMGTNIDIVLYNVATRQSLARWTRPETTKARSITGR